MPKRVLFMVTVAVFGLILLPWNLAIDHLQGIRTAMTLTWWRRRFARTLRRPGTV